jgi:ribosome-binding factor A
MANPRTVARVAARIRQRISHCLQFEINDPRSGSITITEVRLSADLRSATVLYSLIEEKHRSKTEHMLKSATGFIRKQLGRVLETRVIPELRWQFDDSLAKASAMESLIQQAVERDEEIRGDNPVFEFVMDEPEPETETETEPEEASSDSPSADEA